MPPAYYLPGQAYQVRHDDQKLRTQSDCIIFSKGKDFDVNDLLYRNHAGSLFDIRNQLQGIKAKTLILHVKNDQWLRYVLAEEAAKKIPGAKLEGFENPLAHYAVFQAPNALPEPIKAFFKEIGMQ
jgi:homoserine acetyltransferase